MSASSSVALRNLSNLFRRFIGSNLTSMPWSSLSGGHLRPTNIGTLYNTEHTGSTSHDVYSLLHRSILWLAQITPVGCVWQVSLEVSCSPRFSCVDESLNSEQQNARFTSTRSEKNCNALATVFNGGKTSEASEISFNNVWAVAIDKSNNSRSLPIRITTGVFSCCKLRCSIMISGSVQTAEYEWARGRRAKRKRYLVTVPSVCKFVPLKMFPRRISEPCMARSMTKAGTRFAMKTRAH